MAELSQDRSGVIVQRLVEAPLEVSPDTPSDERWSAISQKLRDLLRANKISTRQAAYALPGHAVFVRRVRLPRTSEERLERIIRFEARQQIPFPLEQTILQYQIAATEMEDEVEVLLVAIKREIVEHYMSMLRKLGLRPIKLGVSSFALYNWHMFDEGVEPEEFDLGTITTIGESPEDLLEEDEEFPEEPTPEEEKKKKGGLLDSLKGAFSKKGGKKEKGAGETEEEPGEGPGAADLEGLPEIEEVKGYINIGASTMDLAVGRTGGANLIGFSRSIPLAGNHLTRAIQDRLECESFAEAERIKRERTQVLMGSTPPDKERYDERACRAIMPSVDRMVAEIRRSLDFYISQPDGMAVDRIVLTGGQVALPNLPEYLEERLGMPVEVEREISNPACRSNIRAGAEVTNYAIAMGLALQALGAAVITIDFLPEHLKGWIEFKRKNVQLAVMIALMAGILFMASQIGERMTSQYSNVADTIIRQTGGTQQLQDMFASSQQTRGELMGLIFILQRSHGMLDVFDLDRDFVFEFMQDVLSVRPSDVFLRDLYIGPNGAFRIDAFQERSQSAAEMTQDLKDLEAIEEAQLSMTPTSVARRGATGALLEQFQISGEIENKRSKIEPTPTPAGYGRGGRWRPGARPRPAPGGAPGPAPGGGGADMES